MKIGYHKKGEIVPSDWCSCQPNHEGDWHCHPFQFGQNCVSITTRRKRVVYPIQDETQPTLKSSNWNNVRCTFTPRIHVDCRPLNWWAWFLRVIK